MMIIVKNNVAMLIELRVSGHATLVDLRVRVVGTSTKSFHLW